MGMGELAILLILAVGCGAVPMAVLWYASRAPDRAWQEFARRTGFDVESRWGKFTITGTVRHVSVVIRARRTPGFFQMNATMDGEIKLPGPLPQTDARIASALSAMTNITPDFEVEDGGLRWSMTGTPKWISKLPTLLEQAARIGDAIVEGRSAVGVVEGEAGASAVR